jgi:hypothetical protein
MLVAASDQIREIESQLHRPLEGLGSLDDSLPAQVPRLRSGKQDAL